MLFHCLYTIILVMVLMKDDPMCPCGYVPKGARRQAMQSLHKHKKGCRAKSLIEDLRSRLNVVQNENVQLKMKMETILTTPTLSSGGTNNGSDNKVPQTNRCQSTIYKLVRVADGKALYTGATCDPSQREREHKSVHSQCRLVRQYVRKHGKRSLRLEAQMQCRFEDRDVNESHYIVLNNTLYHPSSNPDGLNLRHGSRAGAEEDSVGDSSIVPACRGLVPIGNVADEAMAESDAFADFARICTDLDDRTTEIGTVCNELLRETHPDKANGRMFSATEVAAMLNSVKRTL